MAAKLAHWTNAHPELWKSHPVKGDIGVVFVPESERFNFAQQGNTSYYAESARGAYRAFFDSNIQPDWVHIDNIEEYPVVYLPYPVMLTARTAAKLRQYVEKGGVLISEGAPGYFGDGGHAGATQPNLGLAEVFGAAEADIDFTPDLLENLTLRLGDKTIGGRFFKQTYRVTTGKAAGGYADGSVAAVENHFGKGRTLLIGSFPAASYFRKPSAAARSAFQSLLPRKQRVTVSNPEIIARLHDGAGGSNLWVLNPTGQPQNVTVTVEGAHFQTAKDAWSNAAAEVSGNTIRLSVAPKDAAVLEMDARQ